MCSQESLLGSNRNQSRSYGSLVRSPVREKRLEHCVRPEDTLQGLALQYGVTMEQIKRANRLYTNESIFLKKTLIIPIMAKSDDRLNGLEASDETEEGSNQAECTTEASEMKGHTDKDKANGSNSSKPEGAQWQGDLSAKDFLKKLDSKISQSKEAAVKKIQEVEKRIQEEEQADSCYTSGYQCSLSHNPSPRTQQRSLLGPVPLTKTRLTSSLRDHEDEIFKL
ncbi:lysM and putative peptidoglycan-binding domain-containing protein 1 [Polypterus senegalus]|uniref:lysM and putative peptidoglycan-binding domain-containing protein 1 n=1 Tax=Polypterus senegalus TaxID=55291 RepID=UPI001965DB26|nr:lysM and putative peptidoglycan-binding domain-containing protein 1 [Polypterus senegalus]